MPNSICRNCGVREPEVHPVTYVYGTAAEVQTAEQEWCSDCTTRYTFSCHQCKKVIGSAHKKQITVGSRNYTICLSCWNNKYFTCVSCHQNFETSEMAANGAPGRPRCRTCAESRIENYSYQVPSDKPLGDGPHYYGVELEVEACGQIPKAAALTNRSIPSTKDGPFAYLKKDGSVSEGFEIVTVPASLDYHRKTWPEIIKKTKGKIKSWNTMTCGLHVHASRKPLTDEQIAKIVCFVNASFNRQFIFVIAGRRCDDYAKFFHKDVGNALVPIEKYEAVNLLHKATIEFRVFRGTVKIESLFKAIEFCDALVQFTKDRPLSECMKRSRFIKFVHDSDDYPHLNAFIEAKWFGRETEDTKKFGYKPNKIRDVGDRLRTDTEE